MESDNFSNYSSLFHSEEAAYPHVLCQRVVECVKQKVLSGGAVMSSTLAEQVEQPDATETGRIALGATSRRRQNQASGCRIWPFCCSGGPTTASFSSRCLHLHASQRVQNYFTTALEKGLNSGRAGVPFSCTSRKCKR